MKIEWCKYDNQFQIGIIFSKHNHNSDHEHHYHIWIELGWRCIEITFKKEDVANDSSC